MLGVMIDYIQNELGGVVDNTDNGFFEPNWEYITPPIDPFLRARAVDKVNAGEIAIYPVNGNSYARRAVTEAEVLVFTDVPTAAWFYDAVMYMYELGLVQGTGERTFSPDLKLTRGMAAMLLWNLAGKPEADGPEDDDFPFSDVAEGDWYYDAVLWAASTGIVEGYGDGRFGPLDNVMRQDMLVLFVEYLNASDIVIPVPPELTFFADDDDIADYAVEAIQALYGIGIVNGIDEDEDGLIVIAPRGIATRAQAAMLMCAFIELIEEYS